MLFALSKLVGSALAPATVLLALLALALLWSRRRPALSRVLLALALTELAILSFCPLTRWLAGPLEYRFPAPSLPPRVDGIVILGGAIDPAASRQLRRTALNSAAERITDAVALARRYPQARLVYSGGSGALRDQADREADAARPLLEGLGIPPERIVYERQSRNTWENALYSKRLVDPQPGQVWLLVTSAFHMPRAVGCFRKAGWRVLPYPVNYISVGGQWFGFDADTELYQSTLAQKEWIGLLAYHLLGRTDSWFPGPGQGLPP